MESCIPSASKMTRNAGKSVLLVAVLVGLNSCAFGSLPLPTSTGENTNSSVSALYVLGDSSVDCGENALFYRFDHQNLSLHPCNNGSGASLLPHILAGKMGIPYSRTFYSLNGSMPGLLGGVNYGSAQATILNPGSNGHQSLSQQLRQVLDTFQLMQLHLDPDMVQNFIRSSLFYLSFGKDDYTDLFLRNSSGIMLKYSGMQFAHILVGQVLHALSALYEANVRKIVVMGILPLGCAPRTVWDWANSTMNIDATGCVEEINGLVSQYNTMLEERLKGFREGSPEAEIVFCDVHQGIMDIIRYPRRYGFENVNQACCGLGYNGGMFGCVALEIACNQSSTHVWWDLYNPTLAVNSILADAAWSDQRISDICRPMNLRQFTSSPSS